MIKHTPGKWEIERPFDFELTIVEAGKQAYEWKFIATIPLPEKDSGDVSFPRNTCHANARLIAAAPDMLEALKAITDKHALSPVIWAEEVALARAAIAKAEGSPQIVSSSCGKCGCPISSDQPHRMFKGIAEHKTCEAMESRR